MGDGRRASLMGNARMVFMYDWAPATVGIRAAAACAWRHLGVLQLLCCEGYALSGYRIQKGLLD